ncbi:MAG: radical SAM protein [Candidatus Verstraetearchaeota archaeon]|nr:radical SAM protein [Candidatus Verstraetearchaeota archaeon]
MERGLPRGCEICLKGGKLVLFVTGECDRSCFYCPLSEKRRGLDVVYADEVLVEDDLDIILEGRAIDAEGTGITGGDPILKLSRTIKCIKLLKQFFGRDHHIHLYTNGRHVNKDVLRKLRVAGLDELRFHPEREDWRKIALAKEMGLYAGAEVPAIPRNEKLIKELVSYLARVEADFLNLNQLEFCPQNAYQLKQRGFVLEKDSMAAVLGSEEVAYSVIRWADREGIDVPIHYCSSVAKDAVQTKNRLIRRSRNVARPYEEVLSDGLLGKFIIRTTSGDPRALKSFIVKTSGTSPNMVGISSSGDALEVQRDVVAEVRRLLPNSNIVYVQEYPTATRERFAEYPY